MAANTRENGTTTIWRAWASTYGVTAVNTLESTSMIRSTDMESTAGKMAESTKDSGTLENSMD